MERNPSSKSAEYSVKTVEDALNLAASAFGVAHSQLAYEILQDNTRTIFGLVRTGEMKVRVWVKEAPGGAPARGVQPVVAPPPADEEEDEYDEDEEDDEDEDYEDEDDEDYGDEDEELEDDYVAPPVKVRAAKAGSGELREVALEVVATLLDKMGLLAAVEIADEGGQPEADSDELSPMVLNIVGDDLGALIGRRGETLRDIQFIARLLISRRMHTWPNVVLDVEGYKAKRVESLQSLARRMADQVRQTKRSVTLEPMPAHERRIIHLTLRDDPDVFTESTGADEARKVQILPK
jgi:spoIIIJ-associated protein